MAWGALSVPLSPPQFIQFIYLRNLQEAEKHAFGKWLRFHHLSRLNDVLIGWSVESHDLDGDAARVQVPILPQILRWDISSHEGEWVWRSASDPNNMSMFPILVQYANPEAQLASVKRLYDKADHQKQPGSIKWVEVGVEEDLLRLWLPENRSEVRVNEGCMGLVAVGIGTQNGEDLVLRYQ